MFSLRPVTSLASTSQRTAALVSNPTVSRRSVRIAPGRPAPSAASPPPSTEPTKPTKPSKPKPTIDVLKVTTSKPNPVNKFFKQDTTPPKPLAVVPTHPPAPPPAPLRPLTPPSSPHLTFKFLPLTPTHLLLPALAAHASLPPTDPTLSTPSALASHRIITRILRKGSLIEKISDRATYFASADASHRPPTEQDSSREQKARDQVRSGKYDAEDAYGWNEWVEKRRLVWEGRRGAVEGEKGVWYGSSEKERGKELGKLRRDEERERREAERRREVRRVDGVASEEVWEDARGGSLGGEVGGEQDGEQKALSGSQ